MSHLDAGKNRKSRMKTRMTMTARPTGSKALTSNGAANHETNAIVTREAQEPIRIRTILVPTDFSAASIKALKYAAAFAGQFGAKLILLHVIEPVATPDFAATYPLQL